MSFSEAIGQVDQIVRWEQQLSVPAAPAPAAGPLSPAAPAAAPSAAAPGASFSAALAQAQSTGSPLSGPSPYGPVPVPANAITTTAPAGRLGGGGSQLLAALESSLAGAGAGGAAATGGAAPAAIGAADPRVQSMTQQAESLVGKPYVWGGGHGGWGPQSGYDCSGFVSAVLHAGGYLSTPQDTTTLPSAAGIEPGPGQYVTIYDRNGAGQEGHVIIEINGQFYESGGEQGSWGGGGGVARISTPTPAYLANFNQILHPAGL